MTWRKWVKPTIGLKIGGTFVLVLLLAMINAVILYSALQEFDANSKTRLIADELYVYSKRIVKAVLSDDWAAHAEAAGELARTASAFEGRLRQLRTAHSLENTGFLATPNDEVVAQAEIVSTDWSLFSEAARGVLQSADNTQRLLNAEKDLLAGVLALGHGLTLHGQTVQVRAATIIYCIIGLNALLLFGGFALVKLTMVRPIVQLTQMSRRVAAGDYGARMAFDSRDEIGELVAAFNFAACETQQLLDKIGREENELAERENLLQMIFDTEPECVALLDPDTRFQKINRMGLAMLDAESIEALGQSSLYRLVQSEHLSKLQALVRDVLDGAGGRIELVLTGLRGRRVWVEAHIVPLNPQQDGAVYLLAIIHNISERKRNEDSLRLLKRAVESSSNGIVIADTQQPGNPIVFVNPAFERMTGYPAGEVIGHNGRLLQRDDFRQPGLEEIRAALREQREGHAIIRNYRKDGSLFWNELHIAPVHDEHGRIAHYVGIQNDISERMHYEEQLAHQAKHDALTGLPNRSLLEDRLHHGLSHAHRQKRRMAVVFVDLDHFKFINDSLGHDLGDRLLVTVANRLKTCLREDDTVARQGGDEFVLILSDAQDDHMITMTLQRIIAAIAQPVNLGSRDFVVTCSAGVSVYPEDGQDSQTLLKNADIAMYRAKEHGRNCVQFYTAEMNTRVTERLTLENDLRRALAQGEFLLHFQPQIDLRSGRISGVEALVRWQHPETGMITPTRFIPLAEETGLIMPLGEWVLTAACAQVKAWLDAGLPIPSVAVNISAVQFRHGNLVQTVKRVLESTGLAPQYLELELTEGLLMHHAEEVITMMAEMKALGVKISLDDFGTGYSSLSYLKRFPLDKLKIDQSFVRDVTTDLGDAAIVRSVILLAHSLGLGVIAEGVETAEQLAYLSGQQCDEVQGYLFSRPIPADDIEKMLRLGKRLSIGPQIDLLPNGLGDARYSEAFLLAPPERCREPSL